MFDIMELRFVTKLIGQPYYLSPKSTLEYIMFSDIDCYEFIVEFNIDDWLKVIQGKHKIEVTQEHGCYKIVFINESLSIQMFNLRETSIELYLAQANFNIESVAIKISYDDHNNFDYFISGNQKIYCSWIDPYHKRLGIKASYIEPVNVHKIKDNGTLLYKMAILMVDYNFDVHPEVLKYIQQNSDNIICKCHSCSDYFFKLLSYKNTHKYLKMLDEFGVLDKTYPIIKKMKVIIKNDMSLWDRAMMCLKKLEKIIYSDTYFVDSVSRAIKRNNAQTLPGGIKKSALLKFSILFYNAHLMMQLKMNSPELYEDSFTDFCSIFNLEDDACSYFSSVIQNNVKSILDLKDELIQGNTMSKSNMYDFYEYFREYSLDVLLIQYVDQICGVESETDYCKRLEFVIKNYISKFCEVQSINSEITTLEIGVKNYSDASMMVLLEDVKRKVFLGDLRYDRQTIIEYINDVINAEERLKS